MATLAQYEALGEEWAAHWTSESQAEVRRFFSDRAEARARFRASVEQYRPVLCEPSGWLARWGEPAHLDEAHSQAVAEHLARHCCEALAQGDEGWWEDHAAYLTPWGFDPIDIAVPVRLWHGLGDEVAGAAHGRWLADNISTVEAHLLAGEDHTNLEALHETEALAWLLTHSRRPGEAP